MEIDQAPDPDYDSVKINYVGFVDPYALEGMVVLKADNGKEFHMRAFSGEVAKHISSFDETEGEQSPSIYRMIEEICEQNEISLVTCAHLLRLHEQNDAFANDLRTFVEIS